MTKKTKTPMDQEAVDRIKKVAAEDPGSETVKTGFPPRAEDAASKNEKSK